MKSESSQEVEEVPLRKDQHPKPQKIVVKSSPGVSAAKQNRMSTQRPSEDEQARPEQISPESSATSKAGKQQFNPGAPADIDLKISPGSPEYNQTEQLPPGSDDQDYAGALDSTQKD